MNNDTHCSICDEKKMELYDWYHSQKEILARDFHEGLLALAEAHANGEHDESAGMTVGWISWQELGDSLNKLARAFLIQGQMDSENEDDAEVSE